jgi:hypothetical protein
MQNTITKICDVVKWYDPQDMDEKLSLIEYLMALWGVGDEYLAEILDTLEEQNEKLFPG